MEMASNDSATDHVGPSFPAPPASRVPGPSERGEWTTLGTAESPSPIAMGEGLG